MYWYRSPWRRIRNITVLDLILRHRYRNNSGQWLQLTLDFASLALFRNSITHFGFYASFLPLCMCNNLSFGNQVGH